MQINKEDEEKICNCGAFGYGLEKMSSVLGYSIDDLAANMMDESSDFFRLYKKGSDLAEYVIDCKLFEQARQGDLKSLDKLEMRKRLREQADRKKNAKP